MNWLKNFIAGNPIFSLLFPTGISTFNFLMNLAVALSDGQIDSNELNQLMMSASGIQMVILFAVILVLKIKNKEQNKK